MILSPFRYIRMSGRLRWLVLRFFTARQNNPFTGFIGQSTFQNRIACRSFVTMCSVVSSKRCIRHTSILPDSSGIRHNGAGAKSCKVHILFYFIYFSACGLIRTFNRDVPYSPSFVLDLFNDVDERIRNVVDFVFLPGYTNPTVAVLCQSEQTWAG